MSDVEAVSLPAALDVGQNTFAAVTVDGQPSSVGPPRKASPARPHAQAASHGSHGPTQTGHSAWGDDVPSSPKADSEAETIIQSGRESLSPEKKRKHVRHDPQNQPDGVEAAERHSRKRPRIDGALHEQREQGSRPSSPFERPGPPQPSSIVKVEKVDESQSGMEGPEVPVVDNMQAERPRTHRKRSFSDAANSKGTNLSQAPTTALPHDTISGSGTLLPRPASNSRSVSPTRSSHHRSASGSQLPCKKKASTPFLTDFQRQGSEDRQSTSSSASGSPLPSAYLRKLGSGEGASASPAKQMVGPKKLRDKSGRTLLARACAEKKYDQVVARHAERPEDLNVPDNAGNTPLQIASLKGEVEIVKFLLDAGCEINTKNIDKDTPLIDAIENGNVEVVKLLLEAGANPRTVNAEGDEPYELVPSFVDDSEYEEMRKAIADAKTNSRPSRRSEEHVAPSSKEPPSRRASGMSPRESPPLHAPRSPHHPGATGRRKTGRSEATRNDLLWTKPTLENLREFAAKGDEAGVVSILNILQKADTASLIAAAKGGHHDVLSLLYAMGNADADPNPLRGAGHKPGYNTPMLAAIGRGNTAVIQLILNQPGFNPTRRLFEDRGYFELSRARQGENWEEEYDILKDAYENYSGGEKGRKDDFSSPRRPRGKEKDERRSARKGSSSPVARPKKASVSPTASRHRDTSSKDMDSLKEKKRDKGRLSSMGPRKIFPKDANDNAVANSDHEVSRPESSKSKTTSTRRGSESSGVTRTDEFRKRRLIAGRRPLDQNRRPSLFSSDSLSGREDKSRADATPDPVSLKRIRTTSPERSRSRDADNDRLSPESRKKKRRVLSEEQSFSVTNGSARKADEDSIDGNSLGAGSSHDDAFLTGENTVRQSVENTVKAAARQSPHNDDVPMENGDVKAEPEETNPNAVDSVPTDEKRAEIEAEERQREVARKAEEERVAEEKRLAAEAERARVVKEEAERAARAAREKAEEEERKRKEAEQRRAKQAEDERQKRLEQERARLARIRREQEEQEQRRRDALPSRLRVAANLVGSNDPRARSHAWLKNFLPIVTALTSQLEPDCATDVADEKWIPNYLVAPLLATNDLQLSQYASWEKRKATPTQRMNLWRVTRRMLIQADEPDFRGSSVGQIMQKDCDTRPRYFDMEHVFWIRLSDFMDLVPHIPHLHGLDLSFLSMHIDREPCPSGFDQLQPNRHAFDINGPPGRPAGLLNGYGPPWPSTYV